jgi:hypothetical protein
MNDKTFKEDAKQIVDIVFNGNLFKAEITRDDMNCLQDFIENSLKRRYGTYKRADQFIKSIERLDNMPRWDLSVSESHGHGEISIDEDIDGDWVKFEDVKKLNDVHSK